MAMINNDENDFFVDAKRLIQELLNQNTSNLDFESNETVRHYISHDEYEMAFEGLFIDLMKLGAVNWPEKPSTYMELGEKLGLDHDSVFDGNFWENFTHFITNKDH
jgi:hypothetical protein